MTDFRVGTQNYAGFPILWESDVARYHVWVVSGRIEPTIYRYPKGVDGDRWSRLNLNAPRHAMIKAALDAALPGLIEQAAASASDDQRAAARTVALDYIKGLEAYSAAFAAAMLRKLDDGETIEAIRQRVADTLDVAAEEPPMELLRYPPWGVDGQPVPTDVVNAAAAKLKATPADIPGLWNAPGWFPELTTAQMVDAAMKRDGE